VTTPPSPACVQAMGRLLCLPPTSVVVWGLVADVESLLGVLSANGLGSPTLWEEGPGGSRFVHTPHLHLRIAQEELYLDLVTVRNKGQNRFGLALVEGSLEHTTLTLALSGWTQDTVIPRDHLTTRFLPGPTGILERFGEEPFTLGTTAHAVLAHRQRWP
jgi:hypothetical protein